ncbi:MAG: hypothetical protein IT473_07020 [Lysobacter sp.]|nr:hypothetical protein [Lysobacter sp.]
MNELLTTQDRDHLRLLTIFHYVFAGLGICGLSFVALHYTFLNTMMAMEHAKGGHNPPPEAFMDIFIWIYVVMAAVCLIGMILNVMSARFLKARRHRTFCMVVAGLNVLQVPFGTLLGVFTLLVLARDSVRQTFEGTATVSSG